jgi:hypothetical protein
VLHDLAVEQRRLELGKLYGYDSSRPRSAT